jgi:hypothetical protein
VRDQVSYWPVQSPASERVIDLPHPHQNIVKHQLDDHFPPRAPSQPPAAALSAPGRRLGRAAYPISTG